jgi:hypothetical protein
LSDSGGMGPILMGYGFVILGVLIAAYASKRIKLMRASPPASPSGPMFMTGLWVGLILGGLGSIFYVSPSTAVLTVVILLAARWAAARGKGKGREQVPGD